LTWCGCFVAGIHGVEREGNDDEDGKPEQEDVSDLPLLVVGSVLCRKQRQTGFEIRHVVRKKLDYSLEATDLSNDVQDTTDAEELRGSQGRSVTQVLDQRLDHRFKVGI